MWMQGERIRVLRHDTTLYPLNRSILSRIEVMISYPVIDCFSDSLFRDHIRRVLQI